VAHPHQRQRVQHKAAPATAAADPVSPAQPVAHTQVAAVRTAAITPVNVVGNDGSSSGKLLLLAALALVLVVVASASLLRLLVEFGKPRRGW
jgi:hypothetical protein